MWSEIGRCDCYFELCIVRSIVSFPHKTDYASNLITQYNEKVHVLTARNLCQEFWLCIKFYSVLVQNINFKKNLCISKSNFYKGNSRTPPVSTDASITGFAYYPVLKFTYQLIPITDPMLKFYMYLAILKHYFWSYFMKQGL